jgi:hypothetical protein
METFTKLFGSLLLFVYHLNYAHGERPERWFCSADAVRG